jgi:hypothetical protein
MMMGVVKAAPSSSSSVGPICNKPLNMYPVSMYVSFYVVVVTCYLVLWVALLFRNNNGFVCVGFNPSHPIPFHSISMISHFLVDDN